MSFTTARNALHQYNQNAVHTGVEAASPHRLIQMLMEGALDRIAAAKGHMERGEFELKGTQINNAIAILDGLKSSLDMDKGGDISRNLEDLYIYMTRRLFEAHAGNDSTLLDEVADLVKQIKSAWDSIGNQAQAEPAPAI